MTRNFFQKYLSIGIFIFFLAIIVSVLFWYVKPIINTSHNQTNVPNAFPGAPTTPDAPFANDALPPISFTDNNTGENIIINTDQGNYNGGANVPVYFSLTNTSATSQTTHIQFYFPKAVQVNLIHLQHKTDAGWEDVAVSQSSVPQPSVYKKSKPIPNTLEVKNSFDFKLASGKTESFRVIMAFQNDSQGEFWIEAIGDHSGYGLLDPGFTSHVTIRGGGGNSISLVQSTSGGAQSVSGTATTLSLDFGSNTTAGDAVVILASFWLGSGTLSATIGSESGVTHVTQNDPAGTPAGVHIFYVCGITGGSKTVTLNSSNAAGATYITAIALEFRGVAASSCADGSAVLNSGTGTSISTSAFTPTQSGDLVLSTMGETNGATLSVTWAGSNIGFENTAGGQKGSGRYKILTDSSSQTATATFTSDGSNEWATVILGLKAANSRGSGTALLSENFDGSSACGDGVATNCQLTWSRPVPPTTTFNYTTSPAPLEGTNSLLLSQNGATAIQAINHSFTAQNTVYFFFIVNHKTLTASNPIFALDNDSDPTSASPPLTISNANPGWRVTCGTVLGNTADAIVQGTTYYVWGDYTKGTGANAVCDLYYSTTPTKPGSPNLTISNGDAQTQASFVNLITQVATTQTIYDKIEVSATPIGNNGAILGGGILTNPSVKIRGGGGGWGGGTLTDTVIASAGTIATMTKNSTQRKIFYDGTRWWVFYMKSGTANTLFYAYSTNLSSWTESSVALGGTVTNVGNTVSVYYDSGTGTVLVTYYSNTNIHRYLRGNISGTTITWSANTIYYDANGLGSVSADYSSTITVDTNGLVWAYVDDTGNNEIVQSTNVISTSFADTAASWTTHNGQGNNDWNLKSYITPLAGGNMLEIGYDTSGSGRLVQWSKYNGSVWSAWSTTGLVAANFNQDGLTWGVYPLDTTHIYFVGRSDASTLLFSVFNGTSWDTTKAQPAWPTSGIGTNSQVAVSGDGTNVWACLIRGDANDTVSCDKYTVGTNTWGGWTDITSSAATRTYISMTQNASGSGQPPVMWTQTNASNYDIHVAGISASSASSGVKFR